MPSRGPVELARCTPAGARIAIVGPKGAEVAAERTVHQLELDPYAGATRPVDPDHLGVLDQLALARARGTTHLLLPTAESRCLNRYPELADALQRTASVIATNDAGTVWELPAAPAPGEPKVFCIGLTKTGTSSLHVALGQLGLRSFHWGDLDAYPVPGTPGPAAAKAVRDAQRDGERLVHYLGEQYDAYSDIGPLSARFDLADLQYPGSRFILTIRDVDDWIDSLWRHIERNRLGRLDGTYNGTNLTVDESRWRSDWQAHLERVTSYFAGRDDLLVLDAGADDAWKRLAPFLGRPVPATPFPTENAKNRRVETSRPCLVRERHGGVVLIEGERHRRLTSEPVRAALEQVLGPAKPIARAVFASLAASPDADIDAAPPELVELVRRTPPDAQIVVAGPTGAELAQAGRVLRPIDVGHTESETRCIPDGVGIAHRVALANARGGTHLLVPATSAWLLRRYPDLAGALARSARICACNAAGAVWVLPVPTPSGEAKVFGIGLNRTATRSLHTALGLLGMRSFHHGDECAYPAPGAAGSAAAKAVREAERGGERLLHYIGEEYDAYSDIGPLSARFDLADLQYPGSRFILTVRDVDGWIDSRRRSPRPQGHTVCASGHDDETHWREEWDAHLDRVTTHFAGRDDLLVLDIPGGDGWDRLAPFLGRPVPGGAFPTEDPRGRSARARSRTRRFVERRLPPRVTSSMRALRDRVRR